MGKSTIITRYTYLKMDMIGFDPLYLFYLDVRAWNIVIYPVDPCGELT